MQKLVWMAVEVTEEKTNQAEQFCEFYYQQFDNDRAQLGNLYVSDFSSMGPTIEWISNQRSEITQC